MENPLSPGLYIVATPIGNLGDITLRAITTLRGVAAVACEDTRNAGKLLGHLKIKARLIRYDDHASMETRAYLLDLARNQAVALISDAGTPLISDPGYRLVRDARAAGVTVVTVPGPSAVIAALAVSGLPTDRFLFGGFLPAKTAARRAVLGELAGLRATAVFYDTGPRLVQSLTLIDELLPGREVVVARELTKLFEECRSASAADLAEHYRACPAKGEIVLLIGPPIERAVQSFDLDGLLRAELARSKPSQAATAVAKATGADRKALYARALELK